MMDARAKVLYHQIHPAKLLTDGVTAALTCGLFWQHRLLPGLAVGLIPPVLVTGALVHGASLEPYRTSPLGRYIERYMTRVMEALRLAGIAVVWLSSWYHSPGGMAAGALVIVGAWCRGLIWPRMG